MPPQVVVTAIYPGADARTVSETVAAPIEEQVNGVEGMLYMESQCTNDGAMRLTVTFKLGTNPDMAQVLVQNRVAIATAEAAGGRAPARRHHQEAVHRHSAGREHVSRRRTADDRRRRCSSSNSP